MLKESKSTVRSVFSTTDEGILEPVRKLPRGVDSCGCFKPGDPCPGLLNEEEAILYLRLDLIDIKNPADTLRRYRELGKLKGTQVSKRIFYQRKELDAFLDRVTLDNPR